MRIGDRSVVVVNNSDRSAGTLRRNVRWGGDDSVAVGFDIAAVHVFGKMSALRCGEGNAWNAGPGAEGGGNEGIGLCAGKDRAQISLVGEVLHRAIRPDQRLAFDSGIVAGARHESRASGKAGNGTAKSEKRQPPEFASAWLTPPSRAADGPRQLNYADVRATEGRTWLRRRFLPRSYGHGRGKLRRIRLLHIFRHVLPARVESNLAPRSAHRAGKAQTTRRIQKHQKVLALAHRAMHGPCPRPLVNGENLSALDPGNRLVDMKTQLHCRSRPRRQPIGRRRLAYNRLACNSLVCNRLGPGGEHRAREYHPGPARELFPSRTKDALGDNLIRWLRSCKARQQGKSNDQHCILTHA